jgi:hypothetical protein
LRWVGQRNTTLLAPLTAACMPVQGGLSEAKTGLGRRREGRPAHTRAYVSSLADQGLLIGKVFAEKAFAES